MHQVPLLQTQDNVNNTDCTRNPKETIIVIGIATTAGGSTLLWLGSWLGQYLANQDSSDKPSAADPSRTYADIYQKASDDFEKAAQVGTLIFLSSAVLYGVGKAIQNPAAVKRTMANAWEYIKYPFVSKQANQVNQANINDAEHGYNNTATASK